MGTDTPFCANVCRRRYLSRVAFIEATGLCGSPKSSDAVAASSVVSSSTPMMAVSGYVWLNSKRASVATLGALKSSTSVCRGERSAVVAASSEATTTSTSSLRAASRKSVARYVRVGSRQEDTRFFLTFAVAFGNLLPFGSGRARV